MSTPVNANYGYTVGDAPITGSGATSPALPVYRFVIPEIPTSGATGATGTFSEANGNGFIVAEFIGLATGVGANGEDLEGLGTNPITQRVSAIAEGPGLGNRINNIDRQATAFAPTVTSLTGTSRLYSDSGADFYVSSTEVATLYNIQSSAAAVGNKSVLYSIDSTGAVSAVAGKTSTEFVDGLAIYNLPDTAAVSPTTPQFKGNYYAFASDFSLADGDGVELHKVDLFGNDPLLSGVIQLRNPNGTAFSIPATFPVPLPGDPDTPDDGFDSGLAFTRDGSRLIVLWENGALYEIYNFLDDAYAGGTLPNQTVVLADGIATIRRLGTVTLPGTYDGTIEYEGLAITAESTLTGNTVFTGT